MGMLPSFDPKANFQQILAPLYSFIHAAPHWQYLPEINEGLLLGFVFGRPYSL
jgi:hypothetical protein